MNADQLTALLQRLDGLVQADDPAQARSALLLCAQGLAHFPDHPILIALAGISNKRLGRFAEAERLLALALEVTPKNLNAAFALGELYEALRRYSEAAGAYKRVLKIRPSHVAAKNNLGNCFFELNQFDQAEESYLEVLKQTGDPHLHRNLGILALTRGDLEAAENHLRILSSKVPEDPDAKSQLAEVLLKAENFEEGWRFYESRLSNNRGDRSNWFPHTPVWAGQDGERIVILSEEGPGDILMFSMVIPEVMSRFSEVTLLVEERFHELFKRSFGPQLVLASQLDVSDPRHFDFKAPISTCMGLLRRSVREFEATSRGYLREDKAMADGFRRYLIGVAGERTIVGINWRSFSQENGAKRTLPIEQLSAALPPDRVLLVSLQYGEVQGEIELVRSLGREVIDFLDIDKNQDLDRLLALSIACDHVISIDNTTAHLVGASGAPQSLLLPHSSNWRWGLARTRSLLYENTQLIRQDVHGDWSGPLRTVSAMHSG